MKTGALAKYFEALSIHHGFLVPDCKWLDPWITVNMLLQLFKPTIKHINYITKARVHQIRVQAQALLREAEEEEEEEEEEDVQFVRRKSSAKIPKKQKQKKLRTPTQLAAALKTAADRESAKVKRRMEDKKALNALRGPNALWRKEMRAREERRQKPRRKLVSSTGAPLPESMSAALTSAVRSWWMRWR